MFAVLSLVLCLMMVLIGQLTHSRDVTRNSPMLKAREVSDFGFVRTKNDCSELRAGTSVVTQVLEIILLYRRSVERGIKFLAGFNLELVIRRFLTYRLDD